jgi:hypothetical protein
MKKLLLVFITITLALGLVYLPDLFHPGRPVLVSLEPEPLDNANGGIRSTSNEAAPSGNEEETDKDSITLEGKILFNDSTYLRLITDIRNNSDTSSLKYRRASFIIEVLEIVPDTSKITFASKSEFKRLYRSKILSNKTPDIINNIQNNQLQKLFSPSK